MQGITLVTMAVSEGFDVFFGVGLNKLLNEHSSCGCFKTVLCLWDITLMIPLSDTQFNSVCPGARKKIYDFSQH